MAANDPYIQENGTLKNKLQIIDPLELQQAEYLLTTIQMLDIESIKPAKENQYDFDYLKSLHKHIFGDVYEWAGQPRTVNLYKSEKVLNGLSVEYSDHTTIEQDMQAALKKLHALDLTQYSPADLAAQLARITALIWQVHPFREGNTRTTIAFIDQYLASRNIVLNMDLLKNHADYMRNALVMASIGEYSEPTYLQKILQNALQQNHEQVKKSVKEQIKEIQKNSPDQPKKKLKHKDSLR